MGVACYRSVTDQSRIHSRIIRRRSTLGLTSLCSSSREVETHRSNREERIPLTCFHLVILMCWGLAELNGGQFRKTGEERVDDVDDDVSGLEGKAVCTLHSRDLIECPPTSHTWVFGVCFILGQQRTGFNGCLQLPCLPHGCTGLGTSLVHSGLLHHRILRLVGAGRGVKRAWLPHWGVLAAGV